MSLANCLTSNFKLDKSLVNAVGTGWIVYVLRSEIAGIFSNANDSFYFFMKEINSLQTTEHTVVCDHLDYDFQGMIQTLSWLSLHQQNPEM